MKNIPGIPLAALFSYYASLSAFFTIFQQAYHQFIPQQVRDYIGELLERWFKNSKHLDSSFVLVIEQTSTREGYRRSNQVFKVCEKYLCTKLSNTSRRLKVSRQSEEDTLDFTLAQGELFKETFRGIELEWSYLVSQNENDREEKESFELRVNEEHRDIVVKSYLPYVLNFYSELRETEKQLKLNTLGIYDDWRPVDFKHPFTFESLAMDPEVKKSITDDLDRFVERKEYYKKVGRAWKRGYLLYGPPGTGKSSLIAAMANYLKFDIYDLQLGRVNDDATLRNLMLETNNKSILVIEDIDCSLGLPSCRGKIEGESTNDDNNPPTDFAASKISLSGLLNFLDGLWSSCGDERIVIFTTNHKAKLDPALLRPGRMDMHIHMSYLTMPGFRVLASNYLDLATDDHHPLLEEIENLIQSVNVTAAQVAEEMMRSNDIDVALQRVVELLQNKASSKTKESGNTEELLNKKDDKDNVLGDC